MSASHWQEASQRLGQGQLGSRNLTPLGSYVPNIPPFSRHPRQLYDIWKQHLVAIASQQLAEAMHGERSVFLGPELIGPLLGDQRSSYVLYSLHTELV